MPVPLAERRLRHHALDWLLGCVVGSVLALLLALTPTQRPTEPVQPPGPDSLSLGSTLASDPVTALAMDIGEHLTTVAGAQAMPLHPDPETLRPCSVEDGQSFALELAASALVLFPLDRSTRRSAPADAFSTRDALRLDRPPRQRPA